MATLFDKLWSQHVVEDFGDGRALIYIDRHLLHDGCAPYGFEGLRRAGRALRRPEKTLAVVDHVISTDPIGPDGSATGVEGLRMIEETRRGCTLHGVALLDVHDRRRGIVHVAGPEQGFVLPGATVVCADSHTATHGAFGAWAFGVGVSEAEQVMATQTLVVRRPNTMRVRVDGQLPHAVTPKDLVLNLIARIGVGGGAGHVIEYSGSAVHALSMEGRMTLCNMSIEAGARSGIIAPDETTIRYLEGRPMAPQGDNWRQAVQSWTALRSDEDAIFDREIRFDCAEIAPTVTWGTNPAQASPITGVVPDPAQLASAADRIACERALEYMGLAPGTPLEEVQIDRVFIGSCTNGRIEDLRSAASVICGLRVAEGVEAWIVPGSGLVRAQAEAEGLDAVFKRAGFQWRAPGCSMCLAMNEEELSPGQRCASTSNRNFEGRQGRGGRTHLLSPAMAAAAAITGRLTDVRRLERR